MRSVLQPPVVLAALLAASPGAQAAEGGDACSGVIDAVPFTIGSPGTWCLADDLAYTLDFSAAITVDAPRVSIDCLGHRIDASALGDGNGAIGISAPESSGHIVVRNCDLRGFNYGMLVYGGATVEDSTFIGSRTTGIHLQGARMIVRRNRVLDGGGSMYWSSGISVFGEGQVVDNDVDVVTAAPGAEIPVHGIVASLTSESESVLIARNRVRGLNPNATFQASGITLYVPGSAVVRDNVLFGGDGSNSTGVYCQTVGRSAITGNVVLDHTFPVFGCTADAGNTLRN